MKKGIEGKGKTSSLPVVTDSCKPLQLSVRTDILQALFY